MDLMLIVYLMNVLGNLSGLLLFVTITGGICLGVFTFFIFTEINIEEERKYYLGVWRKGIWALAIVSVLALITPDEKTMYMMFGAYTTQKIAETPEARQMANKILTIINSKVDEYVDEAVNGKKKK